MTDLVKFLQALIAKISDRGAKGRHDPISGGYWQGDLWQQNGNSATTRPALFWRRSRNDCCLQNGR
jgi:hypothetical protein